MRPYDNRFLRLLRSKPTIETDDDSLVLPESHLFPLAWSSPSDQRSKPRTLLSSRSLVPLVGSSSDQGSKLVTDDVSLASHGDSFAISADTEDDSLLLTESRRSTCVVFSARSTIATEDGLCLAPHGDSSYFM
ncbi:hypothetical protein YC2023_055914 [Brassica napus]